MIHQPYGGIGGTSADIHLQAQEILKFKSMCAQILAEHTGNSLEKIVEDSERDLFMTPEAAKQYGIIDKIIVPTPIKHKLAVG